MAGGEPAWVKLSGSDQVEVSEVSRGLKALAREPRRRPRPLAAEPIAGVPGRQAADACRPAESGVLEQDGDVLAFIYRGDTYHPDRSEKGVAEIIVAKHRNGPTAKIRLAFLEHLTTFADVGR